MITIRQALRIMHSGQPFSLACVTYDEKRKTGGALLVIHEGIIEKDAPEGGGRPLTPLEQNLQTLRGAFNGPEPGARQPHHSKNNTRNVTLLCDGHLTAEIKKIHPPLIIEFNGEHTCH